MTAIQPCSVLVLVGSDWRVEAVSANAAMFGDVKPAAAIGQPLSDLIGSKAIHTLRNRMSWLSSDESEVQDYGVQWGDVTLDVRAISEDGCYLIEAELSAEPRLPDGIGMVRAMSDRLNGNGPVEVAKQAMRQLNSLTGFERVMLCNERGAVIASNLTMDAGLPCEAVKMVRLIADRDAEQVPLVGDLENDLLARASYLAPADEEVQRLAGLGIAASMSLPLRIDGNLVGAVHAFNSTPKRVAAERRSVAHLFAERLVARMARLGWGEYPLAT